MPNTTSDSSGIVTTKTSAALQSIVNAIIIAPNTTNGDRKNKRKNRFRPFCTWLMSLVIRVIRVEVPCVSISVNESDWMCAKSALRSRAEKPTAAFAAKNCAVMLHRSPTSAKTIKMPHIRMI